MERDALTEPCILLYAPFRHVRALQHIRKTSTSENGIFTDLENKIIGQIIFFHTTTIKRHSPTQ